MPKRTPYLKPRHAGKPPVDRHRDYNRSRRDPALLAIYSTSRWQQFRLRIRRQRVLCEQCKGQGRVTLGTEVHHKIDPRDEANNGPALVFEESNVLLWCKPCHSAHHASKGKR